MRSVKTYRQGVIDGYAQAQKDFFQKLVELKWI